MKKNFIAFHDERVSLEYDHIWEIGDFLIEHKIDVRRYIDARIHIITSSIDVGGPCYDTAREEVERLIAVAEYVKAHEVTGLEPMIGGKE
jgi:hypothetical protein